MLVESTSNIRNDYWPSYSEIDDLNNRITDVESDLDLVAIRLNDSIENVSNNLNTFGNDLVNYTETNNLVANMANVNHLVVGDEVVNQSVMNNVYVENLIVNKPTDGMVLHNAHSDNFVISEGTLYDVNLVRPHFDSDIDALNVVDLNVTNIVATSGSFETAEITAGNIGANRVVSDAGIYNELGAINLIANNAKTESIQVNFTGITPIESSAVVGYDGNGKLIPIAATFEVGFPANADYLYTDQFGTATKGTASEVAEASSNLITSHAVLDVYNAVNEEFNTVNGKFDDVGNILNGVNNEFNTVNGKFDDVGNILNGVNNEFNTVNDTINSVNGVINDVKVTVNTHNAEIKTINSSVSLLSSIMNSVYAPEAGFNSTSPLNIKSATSFKVSYLNPATTGTSVGNNCYIKLDGTDAVLEVPSLKVNITSASTMFQMCTNLTNIDTSAFTNVTNAYSMFSTCSNLTSIDTSAFTNVTNASGMFFACNNLTNIDTGAFTNVTNASSMFASCSNLTNIDTSAFTNVTNAYSMFATCNNLTSIDTSAFTNVTNASRMFSRCNNLTNIDTGAFTNVTDASLMFRDCTLNAYYASETDPLYLLRDTVGGNVTWIRK